MDENQQINQSQPIPLNEPIQPKSNNKYLYSIIILVLLLFGSFGYILLSRNKPSVTQTPKIAQPTIQPTQPIPTVQEIQPTTIIQPTIVDETATWKTYTNTEYIISFKYPDGITNEGSINNPISTNRQIRYATSIMNTGETKDGLSIEWGFFSNDENRSLEEYYDANIYENWMSLPINKLDKNYQLNTLQAIREDVDSRPQGVSTTTVYFKGANNRIYYIKLLHYLDKDLVHQAEEVLKTLSIN